MKIIITGNMGYVGPLVVARLRAAFPKARLIGFDAGYFASCLTGTSEAPEKLLDEQVRGDVRAFPAELLEGADAVVQLAAISNDPMGQAFEKVTAEINEEAVVSIARAAKAAGVGRVVFASSCSVYGFASDAARAETSEVNPLTAYARSKVGSERRLAELASPDFLVTCLRFATACGMSPRLRLDLVLNDFVAGALATGRIDILSDGTPWRPLIDVRDMARAVEWAVGRPVSAGGESLVVNVGRDEANAQVKELAEAVRRRVPGTGVSVNPAAVPDKRSYKVDFSLYRRLAPDHQPACTLDDSVRSLVEGLGGFKDKDFRKSSLMRLNVLSALRAGGGLDEGLRWRSGGAR